MSDSVRPQRRQPTRLPHPWDSPGKNTGVGCHFLLRFSILVAHKINGRMFLKYHCLDSTPRVSDLHHLWWSLASLVAQTAKNLPPAMQETWVQSLAWENPLEKGMATHSSIPTWRIPWTEKPGRLQSMGVTKSWTRVSHTFSLSHSLTHTHTHQPRHWVSFKSPSR